MHRAYRKLNGCFRLLSKKGSSVSDDGKYPKAVKSFVEDEQTFNNFRRDEIYRQIVECQTEEQGAKYLTILNNLWSEWVREKEDFVRNDEVGNPYRFDYNGIGKISPKLLQDILTLAEIKRLRPDISESLCIAEIGVGYGSLCRLLCAKYPVEEYTMFDLPDVLKLTKKYLSHFADMKAKIVQNAQPGGGNREFDFVISNYAFSELCPELQEKYMESVILRARHGFIIYNPLAYEKYKGGYTALGMLYKIPGATIAPLSESAPEPVFWHECCIITW